MTRATASLAAIGAFLLAGCAATPKPHPVLAEAAPASAEANDGTRAEASASEKKLRGEGTSEHAARQTNRALGWVAFSIGAEAAVVAGVTSLMMLHYQDVRSSNCDASKACSADGLDANTQLGQLAGWNVGAYVVAAAGLGTGLFLLLTNPSDKSLNAQVGVSPGGLAVRGAF